MLTPPECSYVASQFRLIIHLEEQGKVNYPQVLSYNTSYLLCFSSYQCGRSCIILIRVRDWLFSHLLIYSGLGLSQSNIILADRVS